MPRIPVSSWRCTSLPGFQGSTFSCRAATNSPWRTQGRKQRQSWEPPDGYEDDDEDDDENDKTENHDDNDDDDAENDNDYYKDDDDE